MARIPIIITVFLGAASFSLFADTVREAPFVPRDAESAAQGGSRVAVARGYGALFSNPAGFARGEASLTPVSISVWMLARPRRIPALLDLLRRRDGDAPGKTDLPAAQFESDGFGLGAALGIGYAGGGLGIGFQAAFDGFFSGASFPDDLTGELLSEFSLVVGYAFTFQLSGARLLLGADVRPLVRVHSLFDGDSTAALIHRFFGTSTSRDDLDPWENTWALNGSGIAVDAGLILSSGPFSLGLAARDIFDTRLRYSWNSLDAVGSSLLRGGLPPMVVPPGDADYLVPMSLSLGLAVEPDLGGLSRLLEPRLHGEVRDAFGALDPPGPAVPFSRRLRLGAELGLFRLVRLRAGLDGGLPAFGAGLELPTLQINCAVFRTRTGPDRREVPGVSLELALRF